MRCLGSEPDEHAARYRMADGEESQEHGSVRADGWQKASIIASIFSSIVIAIASLVVTYRIQNNQIASAIDQSRADCRDAGEKR